MGHWLYHWLFLDFYVPVWPNIAASLVVAVWLGFRFHVLRKMHDELRELHIGHHEEHMEAIRQVTGTNTPATIEQEDG